MRKSSLPSVSDGLQLQGTGSGQKARKFWTPTLRSHSALSKQSLPAVADVAPGLISILHSDNKSESIENPSGKPPVNVGRRMSNVVVGFDGIEPSVSAGDDYTESPRESMGELFNFNSTTSAQSFESADWSTFSSPSAEIDDGFREIPKDLDILTFLEDSLITPLGPDGPSRYDCDADSSIPSSKKGSVTTSWLGQEVEKQRLRSPYRPIEHKSNVVPPIMTQSQPSSAGPAVISLPLHQADTSHLEVRARHFLGYGTRAAQQRQQIELDARIRREPTRGSRNANGWLHDLEHLVAVELSTTCDALERLNVFRFAWEQVTANMPSTHARLLEEIKKGYEGYIASAPATFGGQMAQWQKTLSNDAIPGPNAVPNLKKGIREIENEIAECLAEKQSMEKKIRSYCEILQSGEPVAYDSGSEEDELIFKDSCSAHSIGAEVEGRFKVMDGEIRQLQNKILEAQEKCAVLRRRRQQDSIPLKVAASLRSMITDVQLSIRGSQKEGELRAREIQALKREFELSYKVENLDASKAVDKLECALFRMKARHAQELAPGSNRVRDERVASAPAQL